MFKLNFRLWLQKFSLQILLHRNCKMQLDWPTLNSIANKKNLEHNEVDKRV